MEQRRLLRHRVERAKAAALAGWCDACAMVLTGSRLHDMCQELDSLSSEGPGSSTTQRCGLHATFTTHLRCHSLSGASWQAPLQAALASVAWRLKSQACRSWQMCARPGKAGRLC